MWVELVDIEFNIYLSNPPTLPYRFPGFSFRFDIGNSYLIPKPNRKNSDEISQNFDSVSWVAYNPTGFSVDLIMCIVLNFWKISNRVNTRGWSVRFGDSFSIPVT